MIDWHLLAYGDVLSDGQRQALASLLVSDREYVRALILDHDLIDQTVTEQWQLLRSIYPAVRQLPLPMITNLGSESSLGLILWTVWLPLARLIAKWRQALHRPLVLGIVGGQGTGKTTLSTIVALILQHLGYLTLSLSLDDLYKTFADRQRLQIQDPRLRWRGPPGTHDLDLGVYILDQIRAGNAAPIAIPRFDKSAYGGAGDRTSPEMVSGVEIVLFEGWFVGIQPVDPDVFHHPPAPIVTADDRQFARDINDRLHDYLPLWERLDRQIVLHPVDYRLSLQWRRQAEHQRIAAGRQGMSDADLEQFVTYFWKALHPELFITPMIQQGSCTDLVIDINPDHSFGAIYRPASQR